MNAKFLPTLTTALLLATGPAFAFLPNPDLLTISPAAGKAGTTVEVTISGKELDDIELLRFSDTRLVGKPVMLPADALFPEPRPAKDRFSVAIPADLEPGVYEVRSKGYFGLSTARPFLVLPADAVSAVEEGDHSTREKAQPIPVDGSILGTLDNGKFDWYSFEAKQGQRLLASVAAEFLDSKADTILAVVDGQGRELESSRHHDGRDPFVDFTAPADGTYYLSLSDSLYLGGRDYFYHLALSSGPHLDFAFPPAEQPGKTRTFTFFGRNLPGGSLGGGWQWNSKPLETVEKSVTVPATVATHPGYDASFPRRGILPAFLERVEGSNPVKIGFATAPVVIENPAEDDQAITLPAEIAGRFDEPGDSDSYRVSVKKGETWWVEVVSHRLGAVTDPVVMVEKVSKDDKGVETFAKVAENDDLPSFYGLDQFDDLNADSHDPALSFTADADGDYRITIINQSASGSPAHRYRLAVRPARHGFQLLCGTELTKTINNDAFPAAPLLRRGGSMAFRVIAFRNDGFEGDIHVAPEGLPPGVTSEGLVLSGKTEQGFLALWAAPDAKSWTGPIKIIGKAKIGDVETTSVARPASILWGTRVFGNANQVRSRLDMETVLSVVETEIECTRLATKEAKVFEVTEGETLEIPIRLTETGQRTGNIQIDAYRFPGLHRSPPSVSVAEGATEAVMKFPFVKSGNFEVAPGRYQFVLRGVGNRKYERNPAAAERATTEHKRLEEIAKGLPAKVEEAKKALATAEQSLAAAKQKETAAADDEARAALKQESATATGQVEEARKSVAAAEAAVSYAKTTVDAAKKAADAAVAAAKEKTNQFATYSQPITVVVKAKEG